MSKPAQKGSQQRILEVAQRLLTRGPATIDDIATELDIPRSSVHRALQTLTDAGWAHRNLSKVRYVASGDLRRQVLRGYAGPPNHAAIAAMIVDMGIMTTFHVDLSLWQETEKPYLIDSTDKTAAIGDPLSPIEDGVARVLVCSMPRDVKLKRVTRYLKTASAGEMQEARQPDFAHLFVFQGGHEHLWDARSGSICVVARMGETTLGIQLRPKTSNPQLGTRFRDEILKTAERLRDAIEQL